MSRFFFLLLCLSGPAGAQQQTLVVDVRDQDVKLAAPGSQPGEGYLRAEFPMAALPADAAAMILTPQEFRSVVYGTGTAPGATPSSEVRSVQILLASLGFEPELRWVRPDGTPGQGIDGAFGAATRSTLAHFLQKVGWKQSPQRVDRPLYTLLYSLYQMGTFDRQELPSPPPSVRAPSGAVPPLATLPAPGREIHIHTPGMEMPEASPEAPKPRESMVLGTPEDLPWTDIPQKWRQLTQAEKSLYEKAAREEVLVNGPGAPAAIKILLLSGWKAGSTGRSLNKGTEGLWVREELQIYLDQEF